MLTKWGLTNFKSIYNADIDLAPLTVLTGTNSSGKSSLIQSMLVMAQTMQSQFKERSLILNGSLTELGKFEQVLSVDLKDKDKSLKIIFQLTPKNSSFKQLDFNVEFKSQGNHDRPCHDSFSPVLTKTRMNVITLDNESLDVSAEDKIFPRFTDIIPQKNKLFVTHISEYLEKLLKEAYQKMTVDLMQPFLDKARESAHLVEVNESIEEMVQGVDDKHSLENVDDVNIIKNELANTLKTAFSTALKKIPEKLILPKYNIFDNINLNKVPIGVTLVHFAPDKFIVPFVKMPEDSAKVSFTKKDDCYREINIEHISAASEMLVKYFTHSFKYLGPLRFREKLSPFSKAGNQKDVGITGEFTAAVYDAFRNERIKYMAPSVFENVHLNEKNSIVSTNTFYFALNEWLLYLGVSSGVNVETEENGYKIKINSNDKHPVNLLHVGTGVSQVLPILVSCLLAEPDSTLIFEQPELHLHPRVQSRLADFFLSMALLGKQCILETHSEYLIYALRYRISEALLKNDESVQNAVKLYFADKKDGKSEFQEIKVNRHGELSAWPDGFFDERQKLSDRMMDSILSEMEDENA
jgi:predicted ATPase